MHECADHDESGLLDPLELEASFVDTANSIYAGVQDTEMRQVLVTEEAARMRQHVQREMDANTDGFVSLDEFLASVRVATDDVPPAEPWRDVMDEIKGLQEELAAFEQRLTQNPLRHLNATDIDAIVAVHRMPLTRRLAMLQAARQINEQRPKHRPAGGTAA